MGTSDGAAIIRAWEFTSLKACVAYYQEEVQGKRSEEVIFILSTITIIIVDIVFNNTNSDENQKFSFLKFKDQGKVREGKPRD